MISDAPHLNCTIKDKDLLKITELMNNKFWFDPQESYTRSHNLNLYITHLFFSFKTLTNQTDGILIWEAFIKN